MNYHFCYIDEATGKAVEKHFSLEKALGVKSALQALLPELSNRNLAINNVLTDPDTIPEEGDRIDILSPVRIDPKKARALRASLKEQKPTASFARHGGKHQLS